MAARLAQAVAALPLLYFCGGVAAIAAVQSARHFEALQSSGYARVFDHVATWGKAHVPLRGLSVRKRSAPHSLSLVSLFL